MVPRIPLLLRPCSVPSCPDRSAPALGPVHEQVIILTDEESEVDQLSRLGLAATYLAQPDSASAKQRAMFRNKTVILCVRERNLPWEEKALSLVSAVASGVLVMDESRLADRLRRGTTTSEELLPFATPVAKLVVEEKSKASYLPGMSSNSPAAKASAVFPEACVIRISAERFSYSAGLAALIAVHAATGAILTGSRLQERPVQILGSFGKAEWTARINAICVSTRVDIKQVMRSCFLHEPTFNEPLINDMREEGTRSWYETRLAIQLRSLCAPGVTLIANEADLFRGRERDREFTYEAIELLREIGRQTGTTIILIAVGVCQTNCVTGLYSAASGTRSSPNISWKLCSAGFQ